MIHDDDSEGPFMSNLNPSQSHLVDRLRNRIRKFETAGRMDAGSCVSSGCAAMDRMLPGGGYPRGALVQWLTGGGQGAGCLSLLAAKQACDDGGALVVFDSQNEFYPPAAAAIGINLDHLIILRSENVGTKSQSARLATPSTTPSNDFLWSIDQSLRCSAVAAVWGRLGHIDERWFRRFQLSAESSGCLGLFVQPIGEARQPSWAEVQWLVSPVRSSQPRSLQTQELRLQLTRCRAAPTGKSIHLSINTITGNVQPARREHEQHPRSNRTGASLPGDTPPILASPGDQQADPLPVVSQLGHPASGRQRA